MGLPSSPHAAQLSWTVSPQYRFGDSTHLFTAVLSKDLLDISLPTRTIIQYVDVLICSPIKEMPDSNSVTLLNFFADRGYCVSPKKAQIPKHKVQYLIYELIIPGHHTLATDRKKAILDFEPPTTKKQPCTFLGMAGF